MISDLRLQNFRSYQDDSFEFSGGVNIIVGPNASGKTNLIEGLLVSCLGVSYRAHDSELVRHGAQWSRLDVHADSIPRSIKLEFVTTENKLKKTYLIGEKPFKRLTMDKTLPVVLFEPNHLQLLSGPPQLRRDFLDDLLEQTIPEFGLLRRQYARTLRQRNALLKHGKSSNQQMFAWNVRTSELGGRIAGLRHGLAVKINANLQTFYRQLSSTKAGIVAKYTSACSATHYSSDLLKKLEAHTELDYRRGFTAYGPHRDDLDIIVDGHIAEEVASRGEVRTMLLGLKIIELQTIEEVRGAKPILLLDDVFSELDGARRRALTEFLSGYQTFITTTDADVVVQHFMDSCNIIPLQP